MLNVKNAVKASELVEANKMALDFGLGKQIVIYASELASAIDQHPYKARGETVFGVWKRFDRPSFAFSLSLAYASEVFQLCQKYIGDKSMRNALPEEVESDLGKHKFTNSLKEIFCNLEWRDLRQKIMNFVDTKEFGEAKEKVLLNLLGESERVNQAVATLCMEEKTSVKEKVDEVCKTITKETGKAVDKQTQDALAHKLRRDRGTVLEEKTVTEFAVASGKKVRREPAKLYRKLLTYNDLSWLLVGRVDARDEKTIVEVKNRTRRFMCPDYDVIQLQAYMFLCEKNNGILLERLSGDNRETPFEFNESYWNEAVIPAMYEFVREVEERVIMSRSILDGMTPPLSPKKRTCVFETESPSKIIKIDPSPLPVLYGSSWDNEVQQGDNKDNWDNNEVGHEEKEIIEELFSEKDEEWASKVLHASSSDNEPSSDLGENTSKDMNDSFNLYLSPSDTESDDGMANMPVNDSGNCILL